MYLSSYDLQCLKCKTVYRFPDCPNCSSYSFKILSIDLEDFGASGWAYRICCTQCDKLLHEWKCSCGCINPIEKTFGELY